MGAVSLKKLFPKQLGDRDRAEAISPLGMPKKALLMRSGFEAAKRGGVFFEGETAAAIRFCERDWVYRQEPELSTLRRDRRWRIEFAVGIRTRGPICDGHQIVMAQEPYENAWLQRSSFKKYSKKPADLSPPIVPPPAVLRQSHIEDAVEWMERNEEFDPWESNARYVAGFSHPKGFHSDRPRNAAGDFVLGTCPDFDDLTARLLKLRECQRLIDDTRNHRIVYWNKRKVKNPPRLQPEVINECDDLMMISVQQALAGPRHSPEVWVGQPVWKLVGLIYRDHLNARNRSVTTRNGTSILFDDNAHVVADESDLWRIRPRRRLGK